MNNIIIFWIIFWFYILSIIIVWNNVHFCFGSNKNTLFSIVGVVLISIVWILMILSYYFFCEFIFFRHNPNIRESKKSEVSTTDSDSKQLK
jgi:uncharacterized membrane protein